MSYATVAHSHWTSPPGNTKFRIDIQKHGYAGASRRISSTDGFFDHNYQSLNIREPQKTPVIKSDLTHTVIVENQADIDLLEDIFAQPLDTYRIVKSSGRYYTESTLNYIQEVEADGGEVLDEDAVDDMYLALGQMPYTQKTYDYITEVEADGGTVQDEDAVNDMYLALGVPYAIQNREWIASVDNEQIQRLRSPFPFSAKIRARDISPLEGIDVPFIFSRKRKIEVIADALSKLGYGLNIKTYTSWKEGAMLDTEDFLDKRFVDQFVFRRYGRTGGEEERRINYMDLLQAMCKSMGIIMFQSGNAWNLYQITALKDAENIRQFTYNSAGVLQSTDMVDLTVELSEELFMQKSTLLRGMKAYKSVNVIYDHQTVFQAPEFEPIIELAPTGDSTHEEFFVSDGNQQIRLSGYIRCTFNDERFSDTVFAKLRIRIGNGTAIYWDESDSAWKSTQTDILLPMTLERAGSFTVPVDIITDTIGDGEGNELSFKFFAALDTNDSVEADETRFLDFSREIIDFTGEEVQSEAIEYILTQTSGQQSSRYNHGRVMFGDGPKGYSRSAISRDSGGTDLTGSEWGREGKPKNQVHGRILAQEILDPQRSDVRGADIDLWGHYKPVQVLNVEEEKGGDKSYWFFMGGNQSGKDNRWRAQVLKINIQDG